MAYRAEEYVAAESLDVAMRHYAPAPIDTVLPFITQLAGAIDFARAAGVGHGALHPRDIFVTPDEARATGFGVVEALERVGLRAPVRRPYSPPERIAGQPWDTPADVFSLAAIAFELLTGRRPAGTRRARSARSRRERRTPGWTRCTRCSRARWTTIRRARYPTALGVRAALEAAGARRGRGRAARRTRRSGRDCRGSADRRPGAAATGRRGPAAAADLPTCGPADPRGRAPTPTSIAERDEDEAEEQLRAEEAAAAPSAAMFADLDDDIAAEAEADRFAGDDFLLDAAGAASAAPAPPTADTLARRRTIAAVDPRIDPLALEDDEVMVDGSAIAGRSRRAIRGTRRCARSRDVRAAARRPSLAIHRRRADGRGAAHARSGRWPLLVLLALAAGAGGGWFVRGRVSSGDATAGAGRRRATAAGAARRRRRPAASSASRRSHRPRGPPPRRRRRQPSRRRRRPRPRRVRPPRSPRRRLRRPGRWSCGRRRAAPA